MEHCESAGKINELDRRTHHLEDEAMKTTEVLKGLRADFATFRDDFRKFMFEDGPTGIGYAHAVRAMWDDRNERRQDEKAAILTRASEMRGFVWKVAAVVVSTGIVSGGAACIAIYLAMQRGNL